MDGHAAVDGDFGGGDEGRLVTEQEGDEGRNLVNGPWSVDGVDPDPAWAQFQAGSLRRAA